MDALSCARNLVAFDFDWSLINENSDTWILKELRPELLDELKRGCQNGLSWTEIMDSMFGRLHDLKIRKQDLDECLSCIPIYPEMIDAIRLARKLGYWMTIISDANTYFVRHILRSYSIEGCFDTIYSNPAEFEIDGRLRLRPFHSPENAHECCRCPANLCKTKVLKSLRQKLGSASVHYVGDGQGDICPALSLLPADSLLVRKGYSLHVSLSRSDAVCAARTYEWTSGADVKAFFEKTL